MLQSDWICCLEQLDGYCIPIIHHDHGLETGVLEWQDPEENECISEDIGLLSKKSIVSNQPLFFCAHCPRTAQKPFFSRYFYPIFMIRENHGTENALQWLTEATFDRLNNNK